MSSDSTAARRYALSFITGGLLVHEAASLAPVYVEHGDRAKVRDIAVC